MWLPAQLGDWDISLWLGHSDSLALSKPLPVFFAWQEKQKDRPINNWDGSGAQKDSAESL